LRKNEKKKQMMKRIIRQLTGYRFTRPVISSTELIGYCGLYCGACRNYLKGKCPGCKRIEKDGKQASRLRRKAIERCAIRRCSSNTGYTTCAQCGINIERCPYRNTLASKLQTWLHGSNHHACISYIREKGEVAFAEHMCWEEKKSK